MAIKKALKRLFVSVFVVFGLVLNSAPVYALDNPFKIVDFSIVDKAAGVDGDASVNSEGNVENSVVFYSLGDYVEYGIGLKNVDTTKLTIESLSIDSNSWLTYELDRDYAGTVLLSGDVLNIKVKVTYENENNTNNRHLNISKLNISYRNDYGDEGVAGIAVDTPEVPDTGIFGTSEFGSIATISIALGVSIIIVSIAFVTKRHKKVAATIIVPVLSLVTFGKVVNAEGIASVTADIEIPVAGMINLKDKIAVTFRTEGEEDTFILRELGGTIGSLTSEERPAREGYWLNDPDFLYPETDRTERYGYDTVLNDSIVLYPHWIAKFASFQSGQINYRFNGREQFYDAVTPTIANRIKNKLGLTVKADKDHPVKIAKEFKHSDVRPTEEEIAASADISESGNTQGPIYAWYNEDDDIIYWWTPVPRAIVDRGAATFASLPAYKIDLTGIDMSDANTFEFFFAEAAATEYVFGDDFDTSSVWSYRGMFRNAAFESIDLSSFDDENVQDYSEMFNGARNLKNVNLSSFTAKNGYNFNQMFMNCSSLQTLDLSSISIDSDSDDDDDWYGHSWDSYDFDNMFYGASNLETIYVSDNFLPDDYDPYIDESDMDISGYDHDFRIFDGANKLVGGNGTAYANVRPSDGIQHYPYCEWMDEYEMCEGEEWYEPTTEYPLMWIDGKGGRQGLLTLKQN